MEVFEHGEEVPSMVHNMKAKLCWTQEEFEVKGNVENYVIVKNYY